MKKRFIILLSLFLFLISVYSCFAELSQHTNTIYLSPFYRDSTVANQVYTYNLNVNPPDGITNVVSALVDFDVFYTPTVVFTLKVNGQSCNTPTYTISTTYSGSSQGKITFDCSNRITQAGNYTVTIQATKNTGAINGWLDLTYNNNIRADMTIHGTEYNNQQIAKTWLQLIDQDGSYVTSGICFVDIYTPDNQQYLEGAVMTSMNHDGIYYYDLPTPQIEGVYPVIARCYYDSLETRFNATSIVVTTGNGNNELIASDNFETGTFTGGTGWNGVWTTSGTDKVTIVAGLSSLYRLRVQEKNRWAERFFDDTIYNGGTINLSFSAGATMGAGDTCIYQYWNGTTYNNLLTLSSTTAMTSYTYDVVSHGTSLTASIRILSGSNNANGDYCYLDNVIINGKLANPDITKLNLLNSQYGVWQEATSSGISRLDTTISFNNSASCTNISENLLTSLSIFVNGKFLSVPNDDITFSIWNYTSSSWLILTNKLLQGSSFMSVTNSIDMNNITKSGLYNSATGIKVRLQDSSYADSVNSLLYLDYIYVGCEQFANPQWQEVKGSSEIHITSAGDFYSFYYETLCGKYGDGSCAEFKYNNTNITDFSWGYIYENITFINEYQTTVDSSYTYETGTGVDCTAILQVLKDNTDITNNVFYSAGSKDNCRITIPVEFIPSERQFNVVIYSENYMTWEVRRQFDYVQYYKTIIEPFCDDIAILNT